MPTLYDALLQQHSKQLNPVRCARSTIAQLHRYFEDVVLEHNLSALVFESLPAAGKPLPRERARMRELAKANRRTFFLVNEIDAYQDVVKLCDSPEFPPVLLQHNSFQSSNEHFLIIADTRFSALLATLRKQTASDASDDVIWSFEPDVVYSALEFLMARIAAEHPYQSDLFESAVRRSTPKATSLQLTLSVTTKLAHLLQEQSAREIAVNRIATAIRESLELGLVLQKTVDEVATAISVPYSGLHLVAHQPDQAALNYFHIDESRDEQPMTEDELSTEFDRYCAAMAKDPELVKRDADDFETRLGKPALVIVPFVFQERLMGALLVMSTDRRRVWQDNEILMLRTVADQVAVAVNHANLFTQIQQQALSDPLTGCFNRRAFEMQLDHDLQMARRLHQPLSVLMLDLDRFKQLNDSVGHDAGDQALRQLADSFRKELRAVDSSARFGGDEFMLILPQAYSAGAMIVAERLRARINEIEIQGFGPLEVSIGIASFPADAATRAELVTAADSALYLAKRAGRNRACFAAKILTEPAEGAAISTLPAEALPNPNISSNALGDTAGSRAL